MTTGLLHQTLMMKTTFIFLGLVSCPLRQAAATPSTFSPVRLAADVLSWETWK